MRANRQLSPPRQGAGGGSSEFRPTSTPRDRGASVGTSSGPNMDPLLARYIAIKRDMEGRKAGTASPLRYSDPERSASARTPITTPRSNVSGVSTIGGGDARSILHSPRVGGPSHTQQSTSVHTPMHVDGGLSPALRKRLAARLDSDAGSSVPQVRRGADVEVADLNNRLQQQQLELDDMLGKLQASERQLRHTKDALEKSEAVRSDLELEVATKARESESSANNSRQMSSANLRLMEGRMSALKEQLDKKDEEIQQWILRSKEGERELDHRDRQLQELKDSLSSKERAAGE